MSRKEINELIKILIHKVTMIFIEDWLVSHITHNKTSAKFECYKFMNQVKEFHESSYLSERASSVWPVSEIVQEASLSVLHFEVHRNLKTRMKDNDRITVKLMIALQ